MEIRFYVFVKQRSNKISTSMSSKRHRLFSLLPITVALVAVMVSRDPLCPLTLQCVISSLNASQRRASESSDVPANILDRDSDEKTFAELLSILDEDDNGDDADKHLEKEDNGELKTSLCAEESVCSYSVFASGRSLLSGRGMETDPTGEMKQSIRV